MAEGDECYYIGTGTREIMFTLGEMEAFNHDLGRKVNTLRIGPSLHNNSRQPYNGVPQIAAYGEQVGDIKFKIAFYQFVGTPGLNKDRIHTRKTLTQAMDEARKIFNDALEARRTGKLPA